MEALPASAGRVSGHVKRDGQLEVVPDLDASLAQALTAGARQPSDGRLPPAEVRCLCLIGRWNRPFASVMLLCVVQSGGRVFEESIEVPSDSVTPTSR